MNQSSVCKVLLLSKLLDGFCPSFVEVCSRTVGESKSKVRSFSLLTIRVKVKVTWHTAKYGDPYSEFVLCIYPSKCTHTHTHTQREHTHTMNTHPEQRAVIYAAAPGSSWGFGDLLKGSSVVVLRVKRALYIHSPHRQSLPARDSNSQPFKVWLWLLGHDRAYLHSHHTSTPHEQSGRCTWLKGAQPLRLIAQTDSVRLYIVAKWAEMRPKANSLQSKLILELCCQGWRRWCGMNEVREDTFPFKEKHVCCPDRNLKATSWLHTCHLRGFADWSAILEI